MENKILDHPLFKGVQKKLDIKPDQAEDLRKMCDKKASEQDQYFIPFTGKVENIPEEEFIDIEVPEGYEILLCNHCYCANQINNNFCFNCGFFLTGKGEVHEDKPIITRSSDFVTPNIVTGVNIKIQSEEPEIIGDYMYFKGENYHRLKGHCHECDLASSFDCSLVECGSGRIWQNIKHIDITDDIAKLRPWVKCNDLNTMFKLYAVIDSHFCIVAKEINNYFESNDFHKGTLHELKYITSHFKIATVSALKKAGITE